jgi:hypothetical protein
MARTLALRSLAWLSLLSAVAAVYVTVQTTVGM